MKIYTLVEIEILTGEITRESSYEWAGLVARCDRAMQAAGQQAINTANQTGGQYGATAQGVGGFLVPQLEKQTVSPPGYSPMDEAAMQSNALLSGAAESGKAREEATLRGARTGNMAAVPGQQVALTEAAARGTGGMLQNILAKNAQLKAQQREQAQQGLGGMYRTAAESQLGAERLVPEDINADVNAGKSGWLQNLEEITKMLPGLKFGGGGGGG